MYRTRHSGGRVYGRRCDAITGTYLGNRFSYVHISDVRIIILKFFFISIFVVYACNIFESELIAGTVLNENESYKRRHR